jgi:hypothetical protein
MPCPKGFKHNQKYPRPNRQKPAAGVCLPTLPALLVAQPMVIEDQVKEKELSMFSDIDSIFLKSIGIIS